MQVQATVLFSVMLGSAMATCNFRRALRFHRLCTTSVLSTHRDFCGPQGFRWPAPPTSGRNVLVSRCYRVSSTHRTAKSCWRWRPATPRQRSAGRSFRLPTGAKSRSLWLPLLNVKRQYFRHKETLDGIAGCWQYLLHGVTRRGLRNIKTRLIT